METKHAWQPPAWYRKHREETEIAMLATPAPTRPLTPEEESVDDPDDVAEEIDDTLPADLWF